MTWTGGNAPTGEDAVFQFLAQPRTRAKTYTFKVRRPTRRHRGRLDRPSLGHARTADRGEVVARRRRQLDARDRRARARRAGVWSSVAGSSLRRREARSWRDSRRASRSSSPRSRRARAARGGLGARGARAHRRRSASRVVNRPPPEVALTYCEAVEPRFAIVSVTARPGPADGRPAAALAADADTLVVPLKRLHEGWYLVYWRVISVDGHPVAGRSRSPSARTPARRRSS